MKNTRKTFIASVVALLLCLTMLLGTTFAWFTDTAKVGVNQIQSGTLDLDLKVNIGENGVDNWVSCTDENSQYKVLDFVDLDDNTYWEPGCTYTLHPLRVVNEGSLALKFKVLITGIKGNAKLNEAIEWTVTVDGKEYSIDEEFHMTPDTPAIPLVVKGHMKEDAGNEYMGLSIDGIAITVYATQDTVEYDSNGNTYDANAQYPEVENYIDVNATGKVNVTAVDNVTTEAANFSNGGVNVTIPTGVKVEATELEVAVSSKDQTTTNLQVGENERVSSYDVHVEGVAADNTTPIIVEMGAILPKNLNSSAIKLYHVENGTPVAMTYVPNDQELNAHNRFKYDPATGNVTVAMASFSEVIALNNTNNSWDGTTVDRTWYDAKLQEQTIRNAEQLAGFAQLVTEGIDFNGYTVKLAADIDLGGDIFIENNSETVKNVFYPIGAWNNKNGIKSFKGTFDGMGHKISNLAQRGWNMTESTFVSSLSEDITPNTLGLFASLENATVKNLNLDGFEIKMEYSTMGAVAGTVSGNCTFENIAVTNADMWSCNTAVAGIAGWDVGTAGNLTFKNITVDSTNTFHALWGVYDTVTSGILGYLSNDSHASFDNCNVSCVLDIYNDFCGNYMWGIYRYCGMFIGAVANTTEPDTDGRKYADLSNVTAKGCTVNFGEWHDDYYYCEFVSAGHPSYAGEYDYKFRRVPESELIRENGKVIGCTHDHAASGTTDDDVTLIEDGQIYNFIFDAVFGSYGNWGVSPVDLEKYNLDIEDVTQKIEETDKTEAAEKFDVKSALPFVENAQTYKLGDFFTAKNNVDINNANIYVSYTDINNTGIRATVNKNSSDWAESTITFKGIGYVTLSIQDYDWCKPTSVSFYVDGNTVPVGDYQVLESKVADITSAYKDDNEEEVILNSGDTVPASWSPHIYTINAEPIINLLAEKNAYVKVTTDGNAPDGVVHANAISSVSVEWSYKDVDDKTNRVSYYFSGNDLIDAHYANGATSPTDSLWGLDIKRGFGYTWYGAEVVILDLDTNIVNCETIYGTETVLYGISSVTWDNDSNYQTAAVTAEIPGTLPSAWNTIVDYTGEKDRILNLLNDEDMYLKATLSAGSVSSVLIQGGVDVGYAGYGVNNATHIVKNGNETTYYFNGKTLCDTYLTKINAAIENLNSNLTEEETKYSPVESVTNSLSLIIVGSYENNYIDALEIVRITAKTRPEDLQVLFTDDFADGNTVGWDADADTPMTVSNGVAYFTQRWNAFANARHVLAVNGEAQLVAGKTYTVEAEICAAPKETSKDTVYGTAYDQSIDGKVTVRLFIRVPEYKVDDEVVQTELTWYQTVTADVNTWAKISFDVTIPEGTVNLENAFVGLNSEGHGSSWIDNPTFYFDNVFVGDQGVDNPLPTNVNGEP